jgi:hypothetical protein
LTITFHSQCVKSSKPFNQNVQIGEFRHFFWNNMSVIVLLNMQMFVVLMVVACVAAKAKPGLVAAPLAYTAPVVAAAAPIVTAHSSQFIARNYNGIAAPLVAAPVAAAYTHAPLAYSAPFAAAYSPYAYSPYSAAYVL